MSEDDKKDKRVKIRVEEEGEAAQTNSSEEASKEEVVTQETPKEDSPKKEETKEEKVEVKPEEKPQTENKEKTSFFVLFICFLVGLLLGAGLIGGFFYYKQRVENVTTSEASLTPAPTYSAEGTEVSTEPSESASASAKSFANYSKYSVQILNGSGIAGEAGKVETLLNDAGFSKTTAGNAKAYDYEETEIALKESVPSDVSKAVTTALAKYKTTEVDPLASSSTYDIVITVGSSKK